MNELLTSLYPPVLVLVAAFLVVVLPRAVGHALGALATLSALVVAQFAEPGDHLATSFLGFDGAIFFQIDAGSQLLATAIGILGTAAVVYAYSSDAPRVMTAFALAYVASTLGVVFSGDWLTLIFYWELMAVTSTLLVWHHGGEAVRAGFRYAIAHGIGGSLFLFAVVWHLAAGGGMAIDGGIAVEGAASLSALGGITAPALLAGLGIGVNCGFIGLHTWLPDTYPRPHIAASVFLSVFTTKTGAYVLWQAFPEGALWLAYLGGVMAVYGVVFALLQHDMRALLSYHIMAQVGYMVAAIGLISVAGTPEIGGAGALAHAFNNVLFKALLFMAVGVIIFRTGEEDLYHLGGLWREMPITAAGFGLGALSITAIPLFNGFISKGMILDAADPSYFGGGNEIVYWLLWIGAVGTFLSFIKLGYYAFFNGEYGGSVRDARPGQSVAMLAVGGACVFFGVFWGALAGLVPGGEALDLTPYSTGHLLDAATLLTVSVIGFVIIKKPLSKIGHVHDMERFINPLVFYGGRGLVIGTTELYAAVDRTAVRTVRACYWMGTNPVRTAEIATSRLPGIDIGAPRNRRSTDGGLGETPGERPSTIYLRAGMGTSILILTGALAVVMLLLL